MAEEESDKGATTGGEEEEEEEESKPAKQQEKKTDRLDQKPQRVKSKPKCNQRIHELAQPTRRRFLDLWKLHSYHLPPEKCQKLRRMLQQLYAMTPEETQRYFEQLREEARQRAKRRKIRAKIKAYLKTKRVLRQRQQAYKHLWRLVRALLHYALHHKPPSIMSSRMVIISNVMLEQLCEIMNLDTLPDRQNPTRYDEFMIRIADWAAIAAENLYFQTRRTIENYVDDYRNFEVPQRKVEPPVQLSAGQTMVEEVIPEPNDPDDGTGTATQAGP